MPALVCSRSKGDGGLRLSSGRSRVDMCGCSSGCTAAVIFRGLIFTCVQNKAGGGGGGRTPGKNSILRWLKPHFFNSECSVE